MDDKLDETWVTVFGIPQSATSFVLQEFSVYGQIIRHIVKSNFNEVSIHMIAKLIIDKNIFSILAKPTRKLVTHSISNKTSGSESSQQEW